MADLVKDIRLAVDTGSVVIGTNEVMRAVNDDKAKLVIIAAKGKKQTVADILHTCSVASVKFIKFKEGSLELGTACGKPYSVNTVAVIEAGNSKILEEEYA
ncbi:MAG: 50S ribosomal protein L30e [Candidatus Micrarchaeota archaeon]|nr:50S ribosomal protein L30e [Candidatus Micrarchaeota archaeon]MDE1848356.1 50S ribosomal protein L30e [Candidatus Micrarchaeota archaeon]MDE1864959.1 50S ribosomal protein L30e [Candidatus Micrarchaeota archaeon]